MLLLETVSVPAQTSTAPIQIATTAKSRAARIAQVHLHLKVKVAVEAAVAGGEVAKPTVMKGIMKLPEELLVFFQKYRLGLYGAPYFFQFVLS